MMYFWIGIWIIAENNLRGKNKFVILTCFVQQDNLHVLTHHFTDFKSLNQIAVESENLMLGYEQTIK